MANLKEIKTRIGGVQKTRQITSAMKLVSGAKMSRAVANATAAMPYQQQLSAVLQRVGEAAGESVDNPLLKSHPEVKRVLIAVLTTDRGLCGGFNNQLLRQLVTRRQELKGQNLDVDIVVFGRKAQDFLRNRNVPVLDATINYGRTDKMDLVRPFAELAETGFVEGTYDEVWLAYNHYVNTITQEPTFQKVLPLEMDAAEAEASGGDDMLEMTFEPSPAALLDSLLPLYLRTLILQAFLETEAGEHAARMTAMDNATRNASDIIGALTLEYNRARQAAITTQIIEIVSGAEALEG